MALIPKARVGQVGQQVSRTQGPVGSRSRTTAEDFGARTAGDLQQLGGTITGVSMQHLDKMNQAAVRDAGNQFRTKARDITKREKQLRGADANGSTERAKSDLATANAEINETLKSPAQRKMFEQDSVGVNLQNLHQIESNEMAQSFRFEQETKKAALFNLNSDSAVAINGANWESVAQRGLKAIPQWAYSETDPKEVKEFKEKIAVRTFHGQMIKSLMEKSDGNAGEVKLYLKEYEKDIDPEEFAKWSKSIEQATSVNNGRSLGTRYIDADREKQAEISGTIKDEVARKEFNSVINDSRKVKKNINSEKRTAYMNKEYEYLGEASNEALALYSPKANDILEGKDTENLRAYAKNMLDGKLEGKDFKSDDSKYYQIRTLQYTDRDKFMALDIDKNFRHLLGDKRSSEFMIAQAKYKNGEDITDSAAKRMFIAQAKRLGIDKESAAFIKYETEYNTIMANSNESVKNSEEQRNAIAAGVLLRDEQTRSTTTFKNQRGLNVTPGLGSILLDLVGLGDTTATTVVDRIRPPGVPQQALYDEASGFWRVGEDSPARWDSLGNRSSAPRVKKQPVSGGQL